MGRVRALAMKPLAAARQFHLSRVALTNYQPIGMHRDTPDNTVETYFDFSAENYKRVFSHILILRVLLFARVLFADVLLGGIHPCSLPK